MGFVFSIKRIRGGESYLFSHYYHGGGLKQKYKTSFPILIPYLFEFFSSFLAGMDRRSIAPHKNLCMIVESFSPLETLENILIR